MKSYQKLKRGYINRNVCPITGGYKARRHIMSRDAWNNLSALDKMKYANEERGTLRQFTFRRKSKSRYSE